MKTILLCSNKANRTRVVDTSIRAGPEGGRPVRKTYGLDYRSLPVMFGPQYVRQNCAEKQEYKTGGQAWTVRKILHLWIWNMATATFSDYLTHFA